jgi:23S rRNA (adenine2503-C2)-methyltransferase
VQKRVDTNDKMTNLRRPLRKRLSETLSLGKIDVIRVLDAGDDGNYFRLTDGNLIESVLIPASLALYGGRSDRRTVCVSTQVGWHTAANSARAVWKVFAQSVRKRNCRPAHRS